MTERGPIIGKEQIKLTTEPPTNRLNDRGDIYMAATPGGGGPESHLPPAVQEATQHLEEIARPRDQGEPQTPRAINVSVSVSTSEAAPKIKTGNATWRDKDIDRPVRITGYLGKGPDGRDYVSIEGLATGVPLDKIQYPARKLRERAAPKQEPQATPEQPSQPEQSTVSEALPGVVEAKGGRKSRSSQPLKEPSISVSDVSNDIDRIGESITTPEFRSILKQAAAQPSEAPVLDQILTNRYKEALDHLITQMGNLPSSPEGDATRVELEKKLSILTSEANMSRQLISRLAPVHERRIDETAVIELSQIEALPDGDFKKTRVREFIDEYIEINSPEDEPLPDRILRLIAQDEATTDKFISRLIVSELENEPWQIKGFYGNINFEKFLRVTRTEITGPARDRLKYLIDANSAFHNMNYILKRNFEQFAQQSEAILPQHLEVLANIPGVSDALGLYEEFYAAARAKDTRITEETALEIDRRVEKELGLLGTSTDKEGRPVVQGMAGEGMQGWETFRAYIYSRNFFRVVVRAAEHVALSELVEHGDPSLYVTPAQGKLASALNTLKFVGFRFRPMEESGGPELLDRALSNNTKDRQRRVGINTLQGTNVDLREFQTVVAARGVFATWRNACIALEQMNFVDERMGTQEGGLTDVSSFINIDHKNEIEALSDRSKALKNNSKATQADRDAFKREVELFFEPLLKNADINLGLLLSPSGLNNLPVEFKELVWEKVARLDPLVMSSLLTRLDLDSSAISQFRKEGKDPKALEDILLEVWGTDEERRALWGSGGVGQDAAKEREIQSQREQDILELRRKIRDKLQTSDKQRSPKDRIEIRNLQAELGRREAEGLGIRELRFRIKELMELPDNQKTDEMKIQIDAMRLELSSKEDVLKKVLSSEKWGKLTRTLRTAHRLRMGAEEARIKGRQKGESEEDFRKRISQSSKDLDAFLTGDLALGVDEDAIVKAIGKSGKIIAGDLARIRQSYSWFLDDVPFRSLNWTSLGQFYDRQTGDLGSFNKAGGGLLKIITNPFGPPPEKILEAFGEAVNGAGNVLGLAPAQDNLQPMLEAYLEMISEKPKFRQKIIETVTHTLNRPTSRAQEIVGMKAPSVVEEGMSTLLNAALADLIIRKNVKDEKGNIMWKGSYDALRKKFHGRPLDIIIGDIRDYGPFALIAFLMQFFKSLASEK